LLFSDCFLEPFFEERNFRDKIGDGVAQSVGWSVVGRRLQKQKKIEIERLSPKNVFQISVSRS
jgi:hypothetical protein